MPARSSFQLLYWQPPCAFTLPVVRKGHELLSSLKCSLTCNFLTEKLYLPPSSFRKCPWELISRRLESASSEKRAKKAFPFSPGGGGGWRTDETFKRLQAMNLKGRPGRVCGRVWWKQNERRDPLNYSLFREEGVSSPIVPAEGTDCS